MNERVWSIGGIILTGETEELGEKPVPVPVYNYLPQISHGRAWNRIRALEDKN
jgi:hypothetical protein